MALRSEGYDGDHEIVNVNGVRGILVNKREIDNYRGEIPLSQYKINTDPNPLIIPKTLDEPIKAKQQVTIRYLEPLPQPPPGPIIIQREVSFLEDKLVVVYFKTLFHFTRLYFSFQIENRNQFFHLQRRR